MLLLIFAFLFALSSPQLEALAFTASVKSMGMAGTAIAYPLDSLAGAYNPAGMVFIGDRIDVGATWVYERGKIHADRMTLLFEDEELGSMNNQTFLLAEFGINKVWSVDCSTWSLGLMAYPASFQKTHFNRPFLAHHIRHLDQVTYSISPVLATACGESNAVGISLNWLIERNSRSRHEDDECGRHYRHGFSATVGWRWQATSWMALGAAYRSKVYRCKCKKDRINLPEAWGGGVVLQPFQSLAICGDVEWVNWENSTLSKDFREEHRYDHERHETCFKNQTLYSLGLEYQLTDRWFVRAGWRRANSPVRDNVTFLNALAIDRIQDYITVGTTWLCDCCGEISAFFAYGFENRFSEKHDLSLDLSRGHLILTESKMLAGLSCAWYY